MNQKVIDKTCDDKSDAALEKETIPNAKVMNTLGRTADTVEADHGFIDVGGMSYDDVRWNSRGE